VCGAGSDLFPDYTQPAVAALVVALGGEPGGLCVGKPEGDSWMTLDDIVVGSSKDTSLTVSAHIGVSTFRMSQDEVRAMKAPSVIGVERSFTDGPVQRPGGLAEAVGESGRSLLSLLINRLEQLHGRVFTEEHRWGYGQDITAVTVQWSK
jgi:hypothetical protein